MNEFMKIAIDEARKGMFSGDGGPFGSVIVKDGVVVGKGHNEVINRNDPTCHGEMMAIRDACRRLGTFDLSSCELYTTAQPCPMCRGAILWANISKVYYGCTTDDVDKIGFRDKVFYEEQGNASEEIDRDQCRKLFDEYLRIENRQNY